MTLSSHRSTSSPSSRAAIFFSDNPPIAPVTLPALGRGLVTELGESSGPDGVATLEDNDPLDRGGRGKSEPAPVRGEDGPDRSIPLDKRCMTLGRRRGGVAATGNICGDAGGTKNDEGGPENMVEALALPVRVVPGSRRDLEEPVCSEDTDAAAIDVRGDLSGVSLRNICLSALDSPSKAVCGLSTVTPESGRFDVIPEDAEEDGRIVTPFGQSP